MATFTNRDYDNVIIRYWLEDAQGSRSIARGASDTVLCSGTLRYAWRVGDDEILQNDLDRYGATTDCNATVVLGTPPGRVPS